MGQFEMWRLALLLYKRLGRESAPFCVGFVKPNANDDSPLVESFDGHYWAAGFQHDHVPRPGTASCPPVTSNSDILA